MVVRPHIILVGGSAGRDQARQIRSENSGVWCVARIYDKVPYADTVFEMHTTPQHWTQGTYKAYEDDKLLLQRPVPAFPNASYLSVEDVQKDIGMVFTSSFAWMLGCAIHSNVRTVSLYGVNMSHSSEQGAQRDSVLYLLGYARSKGIRIDVPQTSYLKQGVRI